MKKQSYKSGFVAIIGKPNVGKSTILNGLIKEKIAAVSHKPNTTRNRILGIYSQKNCQIIFLDTPGIHNPKNKINKFMVGEAFSVFGDADVICLVTAAGELPDSDTETIIKHIKNFSGSAILVINKTDIAFREEIDKTKNAFVALFPFKTVLETSALKIKNIEKIIETIIPLLPGNQPYFPEDIITSSTERFICQEFILEKLFLLLGDELPYCSAIEITGFHEDTDMIHVSAIINVERDSQKGMIIGKGGKMIKKIGTEARKEMEKLLGVKVFLELNVRVQKNWSKDDSMLKKFGYSRTEEKER